MRMPVALPALLLLAPLLTAAAQDTTRTVTVGAFIDTYYAWDFDRPASFDRAFTTQPARHAEFNVNLAHIEVKVSGARARGRLALQAGTSVQSNYAPEPANGSISGPTLSRHIQEATAGIQATPKLWIDAGVYLSHIGQESWISRDNPTYTRSLIADYSPYYETGVKATWLASSRVTAQIHLLNGWQIVSETNQDKALGMRVDFVASPHLTLGYDNFIGNEMPDTVASRGRFFNEVFALITAGKTSVWLTGDYGVQKIPAGGNSSWWGAAAIARIKVTPAVAVSFRVERYVDRDGVLVLTGTPEGFQLSGGSLGLDLTPAANILWRTEVRGFGAKDAIYPKRAGLPSTADTFIVSSLALTL